MQNQNRLKYLSVILISLFYLQISFAVTPGSVSLHLAYTANLNANLESCQCGEEDLGGMVRVGTVIDSLRKVYPDLILVDSGDLLNTYPLPRANRLMFDFVNQLKYDAIGLGDQEFVEGVDFLQRMQMQYHLPIFCGNLKMLDRDEEAYPAHRLIERKNLRIAVISMVSPSAFQIVPLKKARITSGNLFLRNVLPELEQKSDLVILLFHGGRSEAKKLLERFPSIRVIVSGHTQEKGAELSPDYALVQPGLDGEFVGLLEIIVNNGEYLFRNKFLNIGPGYADRRNFRDKVEWYYQQLNWDSGE